MLRLRTAGLSLTQIGERLGISRQCVLKTLQGAGSIRLVPIRCRQCSTQITQLRAVADNNNPVWCLPCLAKHPKATFGQRLKAYRLAAGLTLAELERRSRVGRHLISGYECDRSEPKWRSLAKLIRTLGVGLVEIK